MSIDQQRIAESRANLITAIRTRHKEWRAFVKERQDDLRRRQADAQAIDDLMDPGALAPLFRARLDQATRAELTSVLDMRRQDLHRAKTEAARTSSTSEPTTDETLAMLLDQIAAELEGRVEAHGRALVWFKDQPEDDGRLVIYDHRAIQQGTSDDEYLSLRGDQQIKDRQKRVLGGIVAGVVVVILLVIGVQWLTGSTPVVATASTLMGRVGGSTASLWDITSTNLAGVPAEKVGASLAYPLSVCVTATQREHLAPDATFIVTGTQGVRTYRVTPGATTSGDVRLADCSISPPTILAQGVLADAASTTSLDPESVVGVQVWGPSTDPQTIAADQMQVDLTVTTQHVAGSTLILADGSRFAASKQTPVQNAVRLSYLVPLKPTAQRAGWEVAQVGALPGILPLDLPAPTERLTLLRNTLTVTPGASAITTIDGTPTLAISLTLKLAGDATALNLLPTDIVVANTSKSANSVLVHWTPPQLEPGKSVVTAIHIPLAGLASPIDIAVSSWHTRVRWTTPERR